MAPSFGSQHVFQHSQNKDACQHLCVVEFVVTQLFYATQCSLWYGHAGAILYVWFACGHGSGSSIRIASLRTCRKHVHVACEWHPSHCFDWDPAVTGNIFHPCLFKCACLRTRGCACSPVLARARACLHTRACACAYACVCVCVRVGARVCTCVRVRACAGTCGRVRACVCMCVGVGVGVSVCADECMDLCVQCQL